ncbi:MAG: hypothetical protein AMJ91_02290 [candidate division Zixibacteria bacterium SM23_73_3]|nr:MAG: hypothetical protein AMJ91_02290 [candidate division Zixibacteria bacterium SM23_73_3]
MPEGGDKSFDFFDQTFRPVLMTGGAKAPPLHLWLYLRDIFVFYLDRHIYGDILQATSWRTCNYTNLI